MKILNRIITFVTTVFVIIACIVFAAKSLRLSYEQLIDYVHEHEQYRFTDYHYAVYLGNYSKFAMA